MSKLILCIYMVLATAVSWAQRADSVKTVLLDDVVVYDDMLKESEIGLSEIKIDSLTLAQANGNNISNLLRNTAGGQIRSYGASGLTTPSFRGTSGSHTAVLWNGLNLQSGMYGSTDLSLLPVTFVNEVTLQKGGSSSLYGSGAIGGSIQLNNQTSLNQGFSALTQQKLGSFGNYYGAYGVNYSNQKSSTSTLLFHRNINNDYPYINKNVLPNVVESRENAGSKQWGILQQNDWKINGHQLIGIKLWYQDNHLEVPASIIASNDNEGKQTDQFIRGMLDWQWDDEKVSIIYKQGLIWHNLLFTPPNGKTSNSQLTTWINRVEVNWHVSNKNTLIAGVNHNYEKAHVDNYQGQPSRNSTALFSSFKSKWINDHLLTVLSARQELIDGKLAPFSPSLGAEAELMPRFWLKCNVSKNYRQLTFNDLYWSGSGAFGNPNLKSETSFNYEGGLKYKFFPKNVWYGIETEYTVYNYLVDNWIQWQDNGGWSPINLKQVRSTGLESQMKGHFKTHTFGTAINFIYNYTHTTNVSVNDGGNALEIGKQLTYTPRHLASVNVQLAWRKWTITANHVYTGKQYTEADNRDRYAISAYQVTNITLNRSLALNKVKLAFQGEINNLLDVQYENRRGYPMYGRNYSITVDINFKNKS